MPIEKVFLRTEYNYDRDKASRDSALICKDESRTQQSHAEEVDINTIVKRFNITGQMPNNVRAPQYGDFTGVMDFHTAMNAVATAGEAFDKMPADVRARFHNDPGEFVDFCSNDDNRAELTKMGLVVPPPASPPAESREPQGDTNKGEKVSPRPVTTSKGTGQGETPEAKPT